MNTPPQQPGKESSSRGEQIKMFLALYPETIPNKDKALEAIGANTAYRAHANELIQQYNLDTRKRG